MSLIPTPRGRSGSIDKSYMSRLMSGQESKIEFSRIEKNKLSVLENSRINSTKRLNRITTNEGRSKTQLSNYEIRGSAPNKFISKQGSHLISKNQNNNFIGKT